jgi:hypothetical protein
MEEGQGNLEGARLPRTAEEAVPMAVVTRARARVRMNFHKQDKHLKNSEDNSQEQENKKTKGMEQDVQTTQAESEEMDGEQTQHSAEESIVNSGQTSAEGERVSSMVELSLTEKILALQSTLSQYSNENLANQFISILKEMNAHLVEIQKENKELKTIIMEGSKHWPTPRESGMNSQARKTNNAPIVTSPSVTGQEQTTSASSHPTAENTNVTTTNTTHPSRWGKKKFADAQKMSESLKDKTQKDILNELLEDPEKSNDLLPKLTKATLEVIFSKQYMKLAPMARWKLLMKNIGTGIIPKNMSFISSRKATIYLTEVELEMLKEHSPKAVKIVPEESGKDMEDTKRLAAAYLRSYCGPLRDLVLSTQNTFSKVNILNQALLMKQTPAWKDRPGILKTSTIEWELRHWSAREELEDLEMQNKEDKRLEEEEAENDRLTTERWEEEDRKQREQEREDRLREFEICKRLEMEVMRAQKVTHN